MFRRHDNAGTLAHEAASKLCEKYFITVQKCSAPSAYSRILKVGRTIADLEGYEYIQPAHYGARFPE